MPSVIDAPELEIAYVETHDLPVERPQLGRAHPGFWRMLAHKRTRHLHHTPRERHAPSCSAPRTFETSMDRLVWENPFLWVYALALI